MKGPRVVLVRRCRRLPFRWCPLRVVLEGILREHGEEGTLAVALVSDREIRRVHREFLGDDSVTDVISFRLDEDAPCGHDAVLGDVVVSVDTAIREALQRQVSPAEEAALYAIHGTLHVVGYEDGEPRERRRMRRAEAKYLGAYHRSRACLRRVR
jgi:probable rRNA maturation factor